MHIERSTGVVFNAFSVTFKFICNVESFHDLAQEGVIYKKENKDAAPQMKNLFIYLITFTTAEKQAVVGFAPQNKAPN